MLSKILDKVYVLFVLALVIGVLCLDNMHFPVWPKTWHLPFSPALEAYYIRTANDPLSAGLSVPNGWQNGMYFAEQLQIPFMLYFLFGKSHLPLVSLVPRVNLRSATCYACVSRYLSHWMAIDGRWCEEGIGCYCPWEYGRDGCEFVSLGDLGF